MKILYAPRHSGKTMWLIQKCAKHGGYIVCHSLREAQRVHKLAMNFGYNIPFPLTFEQFLSGHYYGQGVEKVYVDNVDMLVNYISTVPVAAITLTSETSDQQVSWMLRLFCKLCYLKERLFRILKLNRKQSKKFKDITRRESAAKITSEGFQQITNNWIEGDLMDYRMEYIRKGMRGRRLENLCYRGAS